MHLHAGSPGRRPKRLLGLRSDERLVDLVRAGDDVAFEVLYERHVAGVLGFCRHMLGSQEEAEDAVQHAFVAAHRSMLRSRREIAFKPWIYTIARNRCTSVLRARREQAFDPPEPSTAGLDEQVERRADLRELVADLERLPEDQRAALVLTELRDLSHSEVAEVLGCEAATVKGIVFRARSALVERREARQAECIEIREELSTATGGGLRRSRLRYHLESCPGCVAYLEEVRRQRKLLGVALPVVPTLALQDAVMASVGTGTSAAAAGAVAAGGATAGSAAAGGAAGGLAAGAAPLLGGTLAKVAAVGALVVGGGAATEAIVDGGRDSAQDRPARTHQDRGAGGEPSGALGGGSGGPATGADGGARAAERSHGRRARGWQRAAERSDGRAAAGEPRGRALGRDRGEANRSAGGAAGRSGEAPGRSAQPAAGGLGAGRERGLPRQPAEPPAQRPPTGGGGTRPQDPETAPPAGGAVPPPGGGQGKPATQAE
jgi:RNA polymerase sigma factor (sigma-70 family)